MRKILVKAVGQFRRSVLNDTCLNLDAFALESGRVNLYFLFRFWMICGRRPFLALIRTKTPSEAASHSFRKAKVFAGSANNQGRQLMHWR